MRTRTLVRQVWSEGDEGGWSGVCRCAAASLGAIFVSPASAQPIHTLVSPTVVDWALNLEWSGVGQGSTRLLGAIGARSIYVKCTPSA